MNFFKKANLLFLACLIVLFSCNSESNSESNSSDLSKISVRLMDMPGDYDNVFIEVLDVMIKINAENDDDTNWQSLEAINTGIYDLLELTGGIDVLLVDDFELPSGLLKEIRLVLGVNNTIVTNGETLPLQTPSAQQSGLKIKLNQILEPNTSYTFFLDFDVDASIVMAGNSGNINLKPVIRASVEAATGVISGAILPIDVQTEVSASNGLETISAFADENGIFVLVGLTPGTYTITVTPDPASGLNVQTISDVNVTAGENTVLGEIVLE